MKALYVIGAVVSDHDSSVCLLRDGQVIACINEERLCRVRRGDPRNSIRRALACVLREADIEINEVAAIFCDTDYYFPPGQRPIPLFPDFRNKKRIYQLTHHLGHACSAFLPSSFAEAAFLTVDASGGIAPVCGDENGKQYWCASQRELDFMLKGYLPAHTHPRLSDLLEMLPGGEARNYPAESLTVGHAVRGEPMVEIQDYFADASLGYFYALCSHFLDMEEGSFMGLAAYGKPTALVEAMREVILLEPEGRIRIDKCAMDYWQDQYVLNNPVAIKRLSTDFMKTFGPGRRFFEDITQKQMDFAYAAQKRLEQALVHVAKDLYERTQSDNLVMAGGVALNSVANGVVLRETPFENIFIQPAASDDGLALGFALFGHYVLANFPDEPAFTMGSAFLGPDREKESEDFLSEISEGRLPVEYLDSLPFVEAVDILWKGKGEADFQRMRMEPAGGHRHIASLPIAEKGGVEYKFEVFAENPQDYQQQPSSFAEIAEPARTAVAVALPQPDFIDPNRPSDPFEMFCYDHRDVAGILHGEEAWVGPEHVTIDPTNRCDNNCLGCWTKSPLLGRFAPPEDWHKQQMAPDVMHRTIDELADLGTKRIRFTGGGEPFMHPQMLDFLTHVKERGMITALTTNMTSLNSKKVAAIAEIGVEEVTASIWAGTPDMYARSHPSKSASTFENIEALLRELCAAKKPSTRVYVANVIFSMNYMETREMLDFALRVGSDGVYFAVVDSVASPTDGLLLTPPHLKVLREHLKEVRARVDEVSAQRPFVLDNFDGFLRRLDSVGVVRGDYDRKAVDAIPCYIGWTFCRITPDGGVAPCCRGVDMPMGNLNDQRFSDIWRSEAYKTFRRMALTEKKSHPYFNKFGCYRTCDNLMHNEKQHERVMSLSDKEKEQLVKHVVLGNSQ